MAEFDIAVERDVRIPMRDGVTLSADIWRPAAKGRFAAILEHIPYRKDDVTGPGRRGLYRELAARGFAVIRLDVRGTGGSDGVALDEYTEAEQEDGCEATAWAADQPWCTGAVGAWGISYGGISAVQLASHRPPALKAVATLYSTDDRYTDDMHFFGGALCALELGHYPIRMIAMNALPPGRRLDDLGRRAWRERIERTPPWILRWLEEQRDGPYWRNGSLRPDYDRIACPVLIVGGWRDGYCNAAVRMAESLRVPTEVVIGPWPHVLPDRAPVRPRIDLVELLASWFERHLAGRGDEPENSVRVFVQSFDDPARSLERISGGWVGYDAWPETSATEIFHLHAEGALRREPAAGAFHIECEHAPAAGVRTGNWCPPPPPDGLFVDQRADEDHAVTFDTAPLDEELTCVGSTRVRLAVSHPGATATLAVKLSDVGPDGASQLVTRGVLNLSHRGGHADPRPLEKEAVADVAIALNATAWSFAAGHRLRLAVAAADWPTVWPAPTTDAPLLVLEEGASLELPRVRPGKPLDDEDPPEPPTAPQAETVPLPDTWRIVHDALAHTAGIETTWGAEHRIADEGTRVRESLSITAMTNEVDPFAAMVDAVGAFDLERPDVRVTSEARGRFRSTPEAFSVELELDVTENGAPFASMRWEAEIARHLV